MLAYTVFYSLLYNILKEGDTMGKATTTLSQEIQDFLARDEIRKDYDRRNEIKRSNIEEKQKLFFFYMSPNPLKSFGDLEFLSLINTLKNKKLISIAFKSFVLGQTNIEISKELGLSSQAVDKKIIRIKDLLREQLRDVYLEKKIISYEPAGKADHKVVDNYQEYKTVKTNDITKNEYLKQKQFNLELNLKHKKESKEKLERFQAKVRDNRLVDLPLRAVYKYNKFTLSKLIYLAHIRKNDSAYTFIKNKFRPSIVNNKIKQVYSKYNINYNEYIENHC
jgi:hypothetical protein